MKKEIFCIIGSDYIHRHRALERIKNEILKNNNISFLDIVTVYPEKAKKREIKEILNLASFGKRKMIIFKNPQNLSSSLKNFLYKEFKKKIDAFLVFEIEKDYNKFSEEIKEDLFLRFILKEGNLYRTYSSPTFSQIYKFIYAFRKKDYPQALRILENLFKEETKNNLLGAKLLGILIKNYDLFRFFSSSLSGYDDNLLSLFWETDRLIKEKGISPYLALERLLIKLYLRRDIFKQNT